MVTNYTIHYVESFGSLEMLFSTLGMESANTFCGQWLQSNNVALIHNRLVFVKH